MFFEIKAKKTIVNAFYSVRFWQGSRAHWTVKSKKNIRFYQSIEISKIYLFRISV